MNYKVKPGLYAVGKPDSTSPVLVSANYKMSFDVLRRAVAGYDVWLLVVDTRGINVWCAAGKGTFCAGEIVDRIKTSGLDKILPGGVMILPQLCATGVKGYEVQKETGFRVIFGPVRARDIPAFLDAGMEATPEMRQVQFNFADRLVLTPAEFVWSLKYLAVMLSLLFVLGGVSWSGFTAFQDSKAFLSFGPSLIGATLAGTVIVPLVLPWTPGRALSLKGVWVGLPWALLLATLQHFMVPNYPLNGFEIAGFLIMAPAITAYFALNFTGSTPHTSLSGVRREVRLALPLILGAVASGAVLFAIGLKNG